MKIFKFGGGLITNYKTIKQITQIVINQKPSVVVLSAMGNTTSELEKIYAKAINKTNCNELITKLFNYYSNILEPIYSEKTETQKIISKYKSVLKEYINSFIHSSSSGKLLYSSIVSVGELMTSKIIYDYIMSQSEGCVYIDSRSIIKTSKISSNANVNWPATQENISKIALPLIKEGKTIITQGFIASDEQGFTTTLGKEGSDYTATIIASCLQAKSVMFFKNVPGIMTANPHLFPFATKLNIVSHDFLNKINQYGSKILHKKTIEPAYSKDIQLVIKNLANNTEEGTLVQKTMPTVEEIILVDRRCIFISIRFGKLSFDKLMHEIVGFMNHYEANILMYNKGETLKLCIEPKYCEDITLISILRKQFQIQEIIEEASIITILFASNFKSYFTTRNRILMWQYNKGVCQIALPQNEIVEYGKSIRRY